MFPQTGYEKPGSITLQTNLPMDYSRGVLSNKWHQKREAEPRDYELWSGNKPNLHQSTYVQLQKNIPSDKIASSTETREKHEEALWLAQEARRNPDPTRQMVDQLNKKRLDDRLEAYGNFSKSTPAHLEGHDKHHLETTYGKDYLHPYPELMNQKSEKTKKKEFENSVDNSFAYRKMVSQFTDIDGPKRSGINTFHVQHGEYPNQKIKNEFNSRNQNKIFDN